jgi:hypothetical protein
MDKVSLQLLLPQRLLLLVVNFIVPTENIKRIILRNESKLKEKQTILFHLFVTNGSLFPDQIETYTSTSTQTHTHTHTHTHIDTQKINFQNEKLSLLADFHKLLVFSRLIDTRKLFVFLALFLW